MFFVVRVDVGEFAQRQEDHLDGLPGSESGTAQGASYRLVIRGPRPDAVIEFFDGFSDAGHGGATGRDVEAPEDVDERLTFVEDVLRLGERARHRNPPL
ncbi:hypothetical protein [Actinokineospora sp. NPDC004072]